MEVVIHRGGNADGIGNEYTFGLFIHSNIKGIRFQHAAGNITYGAILLHGRSHVIAQDVAAIDFMDEWNSDARLHFTIARFINDSIGTDDSRIEVLTTEDGQHWTLAAWLEEFV